MTQEKIGRYVVQVELAGKDGNLDKYDVILCYNDHEYGSNKGCIGFKSSQFWKEQMIKVARRLSILYDNLDMACHNLMCYSKNLLMTVPKTGYEDKHHETEIEIETLEAWIKEIEDGYKIRSIR